MISIVPSNFKAFFKNISFLMPLPGQSCTFFVQLHHDYIEEEISCIIWHCIIYYKFGENQLVKTADWEIK